MAKIPQVLREMCEATLLIAERGEVDEVLQHIVDSARTLLNAQYAALGVPNENGYLDAFIHSGISHAAAAKMDHLPRGLGLLGVLLHNNKPIRIASIQDDPRSVGFPAHHPHMTSFLGVPVIGQGQVLGNLYLCNKQGADEFSAADQEVAVMYAAHAAVAIQNARLDQDVQRLAILEERTRIGMDLHDGIIQSIYAVGLTLESARLTLHESDSEAQQLLAGAIDGINDAIRDIRNYILDLRPQHYGGDLIAGLTRLAREFQANALVNIELDFPDSKVENLPPKIGRTLFLVAQNALANVARHAKAKHVQLTLRQLDRGYTLEIVDDGRGFDLAERQMSVGHGLHNMHNRAQSLNGQLQIQSAPGEGTRIFLSLPTP